MKSPGCLRSFRCAIRLCLNFSLASISCLPAYGQSPDQPVAIDRFTSRFENGGLYLSYDGVPLFKGGVVQAFYSDVRQEDYGSGARSPQATAKSLADGAREYTAQFSDSGPIGSFHAEQVISVHPDGRVLFRLHARWDGMHAATLEWNPIRLWAYPLLGGRYSAQTAAGAVSGKIGRNPSAADFPANTLSAPWNQITLLSPALGNLNFTTDSQAGSVAFDAREDRYIRDLKVIWIGDTGLAMAPGQEVTRSISFLITPLTPVPRARSNADHSGLPVQLLAETKRIPDASLPTVGSFEPRTLPVIIPRPKRAIFNGDAVALPRHIQLFVNDTAATEKPLMLGCCEFLAELKRQTGISGSVLSEGSASTPGIHIHVEKPRTDKGYRVAAVASATSFSVLPAEGYRLSAAGYLVTITGADGAGAYYGLQTLLQLLKLQGKNRFCFAGADITDWPSLSFRGAHIFVGKQALPFHINLIRTILSRYKLNAMVIECEYTRWKSHPELWCENSMEPDDLRKVASEAKAHYIEPIPLINTLGHTEWMFKNSVHRDLAEDERSPHNYDASNPETYRLVFDVFREALNLFDNPRYFHIGHDEVKVPSFDAIGRYPARPANIAKGAGALFLEDANRLANWLRKRGAQPMMWGDMLLNAGEGVPVPDYSVMTAAFAPTVEEARIMRNGIPPDAIMCDWRYEPGAEQRNGLQLFEEAGHKAIGSAWFQPANIVGWARQAVAAKALGTLQTTWAGYDIDESILESEFPQFSAYLLAAEAAWTGGESMSIESNNLPSLSLDAGSLFRMSYSSGAAAAKTASKPRSGWYINLSHAANINLFSHGDADVGWSAFPVGWSEESADTVDIALDSSLRRASGGVNIRLLGEHPGGIMLYGKASPLKLPVAYGLPTAVRYEQSVRLKVDATARELSFLQATGYSADSGERVATYRVNYMDGTAEEIPVDYGYQTRALDDAADTGYSAAPIPFNTNGGAPTTLRLFRWTNPHPERRISTLDFMADHPYAAPILFGITGCN